MRSSVIRGLASRLGSVTIRIAIPHHRHEVDNAAGGSMFAEVEFRLVGGEQPLIVIPASVAGRGPFDFVLDTGAGTSLLSPRLASALDIVPTGTKQGRGAAGRVTVALASAPSISVGAAYRAPWPVAITAEV